MVERRSIRVIGKRWHSDADAVAHVAINIGRYIDSCWAQNPEPPRLLLLRADTLFCFFYSVAQPRRLACSDCTSIKYTYTYTYPHPYHTDKASVCLFLITGLGCVVYAEQDHLRVCLLVKYLGVYTQVGTYVLLLSSCAYTYVSNLYTIPAMPSRASTRYTPH